MPYFMRYVTREDHRLSLESLEHGLKNHDPVYRMQALPDKGVHCSSLFFGDDFLGVLSIYRPIDPHFNNMLTNMREGLVSCVGDPQDVANLLNKALAFVALQVAWGDRDADITEDLLEPLWAFLFCRWDGLVQTDDEGWQDAFGLVLAVK